MLPKLLSPLGHGFPQPWQVLPQHSLLKDIEIGFNVVVGAKLAEQMVGLLTGIREGKSLSGLMV